MKSIKERSKMELQRFMTHSPVFAPIRYIQLKEDLYKNARAAIKFFGVDYSDALCRDIIRKYCLHEISMREYFLLDCAGRSYREIEAFIGNRELRYWVGRMNDSEKKHIFDNKYETYCTYRPYYGREMIAITEDNEFPLFSEFLSSAGSLFVKPIDGSSGKGIYQVKSGNDRIARAMFNLMRIRYPHGFVAEEPVIQCSEMAAFNSESVNTVRMPTIRHKNHVRIWHPFFRTGIGNSIVDNADHGGIEILIDERSGILGGGIDMLGNKYYVHPNTGKALQGIQLPRWQEAVELATELAYIVPEMRYVGWDLALTDNGWVVIEGNATAMMAQEIEKKGLKKDFKNELKEIRREKL